MPGSKTSSSSRAQQQQQQQHLVAVVQHLAVAVAQALVAGQGVVLLLVRGQVAAGTVGVQG
jgi:hypothetical protein